MSRSSRKSPVQKANLHLDDLGVTNIRTNNCLNGRYIDVIFYHNYTGIQGKLKIEVHAIRKSERSGMLLLFLFVLFFLDIFRIIKFINYQ